MRVRWSNLLRQFWSRTVHSSRISMQSSRRARRGKFPAVEPMEARVMLAGPTLTVSLTSLSVVETSFSNGIPATVTRTDADTSQALTVNLFSSDTSEATVPATVTIAAGAKTANFLVMPADDTSLDGTQTAQITATAPGFTYASSVTAPAGLDTTFGTNGYSTVPQAWALSSVLPDVLIQPNGSIVSFSQTPNVSNSWTLVRRTAEGAVDTGFGTNGTVTTTLTGSNLAPNSLTLQSDGKIIAVGHISGGVNVWDDLVVARYNTNGQLDTTFGSSGVVRIERSTHVNIKNVVINSDGSLLIVGGEANSNFIAKLNSNGTIHTSFGTNGYAVNFVNGFTYSTLRNLFVQSDGKLLALGTGAINGTGEASVYSVRYLANGAIDTTYGTNGVRIYDLNPAAVSASILQNAALQSDGKLVLAGYDRNISTGNYDWVVARLNSDGTLDNTFSADGTTLIEFTNGLTDYGNDVVIQPDGRILVMGSGAIPPNGYDLAFARLNTDGTLDATFDGDGKLTLAPWPGTVFEQVWAGQLASTNQLVFLAGYNTDMRIGRLNLNSPSPIRDVLTVTDNESVRVIITETSVAETAGTITATISRSDTDDLSLPLTVSLLSSDTSELTVPATVEIPAGQASTTFTVSVVDDPDTDGTQSATITPSANGYLSVSDAVSVTDNDTNAAPHATGGQKITNEDTSVSGQLTATDADNDPLTFSLVTGPQHGQLTLNPNGSYTYTPDANYYGTDSFFFRAYDGRAYSNTADIALIVSSVNDAPVAINDSYVLDEDTVFSTDQAAQGVTRIQMVSDPGDWIGAGRTYDLTTGINGIASANGTYVRVIYANPNNSNDYFWFEFESPFSNQPLSAGTYLGATRYPFNNEGTPGLSVTGQFRGSNTLTGFFTIEQINYTAAGQLLNFKATFEQHSEGGTPALRGTVQYNATTSTPAGVLENDKDIEGQTLGATLIDAPQHGAVTLNPNGTFSYTPHANYVGPDSFTYLATDGLLTSNTATVSLTVRSVADAPTINPQSFFAEENQQPVASLGTVIATDGDAGQSLTYAITQSSHPGAFAIDPQTGELTVVDGSTLNYEQATSAVLTVTVTDNDSPALSSSATITVQLQDVNEVPLITTDSLTINENPAVGASLGTIAALDPDAGTTLTYQLLSNTDGALVINPVTGELTAGTNTAYFNFEQGDTREFFVGVSDGTLFTSRLVTLHLQDVNEAPLVSAPIFSVDENAYDLSVVGTINASDPDPNQTLTFSIVSSTIPQAFGIDPQYGVLYVLDHSLLDYEATPTATVMVRATDNGQPALSTTIPVTIQLNDRNEVPQIANQAFAVAENSGNGTSVGTVLATDVDAGQSLIYSIADSSLPGAFTINPQTGQLTVANTALLNYEAISTITLLVSVTDNGLPTQGAFASVTVSLTNVNDAPTLSGQTFSVHENANQGTVVGTMTAVEQDSGQSLIYTISASSLPDAFQIHPFTGEIMVSNSFVLDYETVGAVTLTVRATDNGTPSRFGETTVTVNLTDRNESPVMAAQTFTVAENTLTGNVVGTVIATDVDQGQALTYTISSSPVPGAFAINPATGVITVANGSLLNYESRTSIELGVFATDNGVPVLATVAPITIQITDVNERPTLTDRNFTVAENAAAGTIVGTFPASDVDVGQSITYAITSSAPISGAFAINSTTGQITVVDGSGLNFEAISAVVLTITVTDNGNPALSSSALATITLTNINEAPVVSNTSFDVSENTLNSNRVGFVTGSDVDVGQSLTYSISSSTLPGAFAINSTTGEITVTNSTLLNYESVPTATLTVRAADNGVPALSSTATVTINITDVNERPVVTNQAFTVTENAATGTVVGTFTASDVDAGQSLSYTITASAPIAGAFAINSTTGQITVVNGSGLNFEAISAVALTITVTDNGNPSLSASAVATITLTDVNEAPVVTPMAFTIFENSINGAFIGTIAASDPDAGQSRTFAITAGNTNNAFAINPSTGVLSVNNSAALNYEAITLFNLTVTATDNGSPARSGSAAVTVNLLNVNEAPVVTPTAFTIYENSVNGAFIGTIATTDPDAGQTRTFAITAGNTNNAFAISATTGVLSVNSSAALNFEANPVFNLTITATDNGTPVRSGSATVTVNLLNVNEAPVVAAQSMAVKTKSKTGTVVGTVSATDPDAGQTRTYTIVSGNGPSNKPVFAINATTGVITVKTSSSVVSKGTYTLGVLVTDNGSPALSTTGTITIYVNASGTVPTGGRLQLVKSATGLVRPAESDLLSAEVVTVRKNDVAPLTPADSSNSSVVPLLSALPRKSKSLSVSLTEWLKRRS